MLHIDENNTSNSNFSKYVFISLANLRFVLVKLKSLNTIYIVDFLHGLRTPGEEITFIARPKIHSRFFKYD